MKNFLKKYIYKIKSLFSIITQTNKKGHVFIKNIPIIQINKKETTFQRFAKWWK